VTTPGVEDSSGAYNLLVGVQVVKSITRIIDEASGRCIGVAAKISKDENAIQENAVLPDAAQHGIDLALTQI
jgi:hypothetical protein